MRTRNLVPHAIIILLGTVLVAATPVDAKSPIGSITRKIMEKAGTKASVDSTVERAVVKAARTRIIRKLPDEVASTFAKGRYSQQRLKQPIIVYRYHGDYNDRPRRFAYLTTQRFPNEVTARHSLAIPTMPGINGKGYRHLRWVTRYELPRGTLISTGKVAPYKQFRGGGIQIVVENLPQRYRRDTLSFKEFRSTAKPLAGPKGQHGQASGGEKEWRGIHP